MHQLPESLGRTDIRALLLAAALSTWLAVCLLAFGAALIEEFPDTEKAACEARRKQGRSWKSGVETGAAMARPLRIYSTGPAGRAS